MPRELGALAESLARLTTCCTSCEAGGPCEGKVKTFHRAKTRRARASSARFAKIQLARPPR